MPVPYHVYDGHVILIGASISSEAARRLLQGQRVTPILTRSGRALMTIWICHFQQASLGEHYELQYSIAVSHQPLAAVSDHPLGLFHLMLNVPQNRLFIHQLWNDSPEAIAYNRDLLMLDAGQCLPEITLQADRAAFSFTTPTGEILLSGSVKRQPRTSVGVNFSLMKAIGFQGMRNFSAHPWIAAKTTNRLGLAPYHIDAETYTQPMRTVLQLPDHTDELTQIHPAYQDADIRLQFIEHLEGFRFVYLHPHTPVD